MNSRNREFYKLLLETSDDSFDENDEYEFEEVELDESARLENLRAFSEKYKKKQMFLEMFDNPYSFSADFKTGKQSEYVIDRRTGQYRLEQGEGLAPKQFISFKTDRGETILWVAHRDAALGSWGIAFGKINSVGMISFDLTNSGDPFRIIATIIEITKRFIKADQAKRVKMIHFSSDNPKRSRVYKNTIIPAIRNFILVDKKTIGDTDHFLLQRIS